MATVIRAIGANFINENVIGNERLDYNGLVYAIRPDSNIKLKDISGHGLQPSIRGALEYDNQSVICRRGRNGFRVGITETPSLTWFNTYKAGANISTNKSSAIGINTWGKTNSSGSSIHNTENTANIYAQWYDGSNGNNFYPTNVSDGWVSVAMVIDAAADKVTFYYIQGGQVKSVFWDKKKGDASKNLGLSGRKIEMSQKLSFGIISNESVVDSDNTFTGDYYCAEALAYDRSLSESEVIAQLMRTKTAMAAKGIIL